MLPIKITTFSILFASMISVKCSNLMNLDRQGDENFVLLNNIESNKRNDEQLKFIYQNYSRVHRNLDNNGVIYGESSSKCGGTFKSVQTTIQSPDYPNEYQSNSYCEYVFKSPFVCKNEFHIQFLFFSLESSKDCVKDHLKIGKHETLCGKVIGIMKYKAMDGVLKITFASDDNVEGPGFNLLVTRLPCSDEESSTIYPIYEKRTTKNEEWDVNGIEFTTSSDDESFTGSEADGQGMDETTQPVLHNDVTEPILTLQPPIYNHFVETQNKSYQFSILGSNGNGYLPPSSTDIPTHTNCFPAGGGQYPVNWGQFPVNGGQFPVNGGQFPVSGQYPIGQFPTFGSTPSNGYPTTQFYPSIPNIPPPSIYPPSNYPSFNGYLPPVHPTNNFPPSNGYFPPPNGFIPQNPNQFPNTPSSSYPNFPVPNDNPINSLNPSSYPHSQPPNGIDLINQGIVPVITPTRDVIQSQRFPSAIPQCCTRQFNQQRFYVASPNFPTKTIQNIDCLHYINRNNPSTCRIRIEFKFFLFGDYDPQLGCVDNFIEIDGQRICGCRSGMRYISQWGIGSKIIRVQSRSGIAQGVRGFLLDVIQEQCPYRISRANGSKANETNWDRSDSVLRKAVTQTNSSSLTTFYYYVDDDDDDADKKPKVRLESNAEFEQRAEGPNARFFFPPTNPQDRCGFSNFHWIQLLADPLWVSKPPCRS